MLQRLGKRYLRHSSVKVIQIQIDFILTFYSNNNPIIIKSMNFLKSTWGKLFGSSSNQPSNVPSQQHHIPTQILTELFELTSKFMRQSQVMTDNQTKLKLYGYYKQSIEGDCNTPKPQIFDLVGKSKWNAWNELKGKQKEQCMKIYIVMANNIDSTIEKKIAAHYESDEKEEISEQKVSKGGGIGFKKVQAVDYSDEYSHPYFKPIQKGENITEIDHTLLLQKNNSPAVYPLHFAIDKQRIDLVQKFMDLLSVEQIEEMVDEEGTGIMQYAQLIENEEILEVVSKKLK